MKKLYFVLFQFIGLGLFAQALTTNPSPIVVDQPVTITVFVNSTDTDCNHFNNPTKVYMHAGIGDNSSPWGFAVVGNWGQDDGVGLMTDNGDGSWSITITPSTYFNLTTAQISQATKMGMVFRNEDGSQEFKDNGCQDFILDVVQSSSSVDNKDFEGVKMNYNSGFLKFNLRVSNFVMYDLAGKEIKKIDGKISPDREIFVGDVKKGLYILQFEFNNRLVVRKFLLN